MAATANAPTPLEATREGEEYPLERLIGRELMGRYRLDGILSIGGTGAVFRGHQLTLKRDVAVKILHPELTRNERIFKRFRREAESTARFEHPNIVQVLEAGSTEDGFHFIVMQLLGGGELFDLLGEPVPPRRTCELMLQVFRGLEHAHDKGVVHRDLKPENIFLTRDHEGLETIKLVDFGLAKLLEDSGDSETLTRLGMVFGTPSYMSPEQATGSPIDARTDLYSAGLIFYGMLAGRPAFTEEDPVALMQAQVKQQPPPLPDDIPTELAELVFALLAKNPTDRPSGASEVRTRLEDLLPRMPAEFGGRRRALVGWWKYAIVAAGAAVLALLMISFGGREDASSSAGEPTPASVADGPTRTGAGAAEDPVDVPPAVVPVEPAATRGPDPAAKPEPPPAKATAPATETDPKPTPKSSGPSSGGAKKKKKKKKKKGLKNGGFRRPGGG